MSEHMSNHMSGHMSDHIGVYLNQVISDHGAREGKWTLVSGVVGAVDSFLECGICRHRVEDERRFFSVFFPTPRSVPMANAEDRMSIRAYVKTRLTETFPTLPSNPDPAARRSPSARPRKSCLK